MKRTKTTGQTCVGDLRLTPLDVGFDLRLSDMTVRIPEDFCSVGLDIGGETYLIEGTRDEMIAEIRAAGYRVAAYTISYQRLIGQSWLTVDGHQQAETLAEARRIVRRALPRARARKPAYMSRDWYEGLCREGSLVYATRGRLAIVSAA